MKLQLPDVTLICIDTVCHDLAALAIKDCVRHCDFAEVIAFSDKAIIPADIGCNVVCEVDSLLAQQEFLWTTAWQHVHTSHFLVVHWDSWVIDPEMWRDVFMAFDYIGAPWWHRDRYCVGNGGFSLRSTRLAAHLATNKKRYPITHPEDVALCRRHRFGLEREGFIWADFDTASDFAFEWVRKSDDQRHFGFHSLRNFPFVLTRDQLDERMALMGDYEKKGEHYGYMQRNMRVMAELGREPGYVQ